ncbi:hypothetical protein HEQ62_10020 [Haematospirillum jordaniae]|uniref:Uncharacterized protein n=1 Tax=Haematospirillum jordaniae TaxID=1549855 RepID=A0A143DC22_9PROT|nr:MULTISPECIES: hypothetical protein [Haematospirillum]AMW34275.1 hypothetical protein AY555_02730 [Haematospirillum jordaniae]NKD46305.1 hypothetical protein [Haematospirillum jordaniae]NKD55980.1 hypothetical protein [Haematospirillum sp. H4890]NKD58057.1 hypothetical protein [Haematospirillum jordaniae]NKD60105.1 hypothetical protein [Haematospirillum jordaniae]
MNAFLFLGRSLWMLSCVVLTATALLANYPLAGDMPVSASLYGGDPWVYAPWLVPPVIGAALVLPGLLLWLPVCLFPQCGSRKLVVLLLASHAVGFLVIPVMIYEGWLLRRWICTPETDTPLSSAG